MYDKLKKGPPISFFSVSRLFFMAMSVSVFAYALTFRFLVGV